MARGARYIASGMFRVLIQVVAWRKEHYGKFYDGDSYIVLHSYHKEGSDVCLQPLMGVQ